jgi:transcriptional regulator with XRE-family HTH domain
VHKWRLWQVLTASQIRAARTALGWSGSDLAAAASVSLRTITKIESASDMPDVRLVTIKQIKKALESHGIEFITSADGAPGIVIRPPVSK